MSINQDLKARADPIRAANLKRFFKTGKGEYGEGDMFLGLTVPECREIAKKYGSLSFEEIENHLNSKFHEERLIALLILVNKYDKEIIKRKAIFDFYLAHTYSINNWDLVDLSAHKIVGRFLYDLDKDFPVYRSILRKLAQSSNLWEKRIAIISTFYFIKNGSFDYSLDIAEKLLLDKHDLIHKAVGWMLREIGKKDKKVLDKFLTKHYKLMPRTMLRYAIEKHSRQERQEYMERE